MREQLFTIEVYAHDGTAKSASGMWQAEPPERWQWREADWTANLSTTRFERKVRVYVLSRISLRLTPYELQALCRVFLSSDQRRFTSISFDDILRKACGETIFPTIPYDYLQQ